MSTFLVFAFILLKFMSVEFKGVWVSECLGPRNRKKKFLKRKMIDSAHPTIFTFNKKEI